MGSNTENGLNSDNHFLGRDTLLLDIKAKLNTFEAVADDQRVGLGLQGTLCQSFWRVGSPNPLANILVRLLNDGVGNDYIILR